MSSYNNYYSKIGQCKQNTGTGSQGAQGSTGAQGPIGPIGFQGSSGGIAGKDGTDGTDGKDGKDGDGNMTIGLYNNNNIDVSYPNINNILFDTSSGFVIDLCNNIISDSSSILISLGNYLKTNTFKTWNISGSETLVADGVDSINIINGDNLVLESSNTNPKYLTINAIPQLSTIFDGSKNLVLESGYNFIPQDICGQNLGSTTNYWKNIYADHLFTSSNSINIGNVVLSGDNSTLLINNVPLDIAVLSSVEYVDTINNIRSDISTNYISIVDLSNEIYDLSSYVYTTQNTNITDLSNEIYDLSSYVYTIQNTNITDLSNEIYDLSSYVYTIQNTNITNLSNEIYDLSNEIYDLSSYVYTTQNTNITDLSNEIYDLSSYVYTTQNTNINDLSNRILTNTNLINNISNPGYIQTQYKNNNFKNYYVTSNLTDLPDYNLTIIPSQQDNNIIVNIRLNYLTSGYVGHKLRIQIGYTVSNLSYEEIIGDEIMGTENTTTLEQSYNFNFINKSLSNDPHYYWVKVQKIDPDNPQVLEISYDTQILDKSGNLLMLQEVTGTTVNSSDNTTWLNQNNNSINYNLGNVGINTNNPSETLVVNGNVKIIGNNSFLNIPSNPPTHSNSNGNQGDITYDSSYIYMCVENNSWKRSHLDTW